MGKLEDALVEAREIIEAQAAELERLGTSALSNGLVVALDGKSVLVATGGEIIRCAQLEEGKEVSAGDTVWLLPQTKQIIDSAKLIPYGDVVAIKSVHDGSVEITGQNGDSRIVSNGKVGNLGRGDRVLLDSTRAVVVKIVEKAPDKPKDIANITWDEVGGHDEAKQLLREAVELPYLHPEVYSKYNKRITRGIQMYGPPGCGKTMLGKAVATAVKGAFLSIKGPEILDPFVGVAEANVRNIFAQARDYKAKTGRPAVIFIDEADAILSARGAYHGAGGMEHTIVPTFLTEMDGLATSAAIVILSTNRPELLDPAIVRDGRIDYKVEIKRPTPHEAKAIFGIHLKGIPVVKDCSMEALVDLAIDQLYSVKSLPHSGALIAGVVDKASAHAIRRDISAGGKFTGISTADMLWAVATTIQQEAPQH